MSGGVGGLTTTPEPSLLSSHEVRHSGCRCLAVSFLLQKPKHPMTMPDSPVWEDIRHAYETSAETVREIGIRFGIPHPEISRRANLKDSGWKLRERGIVALQLANAKRAAMRLEASVTPAASVVSPSPPSPKPHHISGGPTHRRAIIRRLYDVLDAKLTEIEARIADNTVLSDPAAEREARQLANLIKIFEKLTELSDAPAKITKTTATPVTAADQNEDDAERFRQDLLERFARLQQQPPAAPAAP